MDFKKIISILTLSLSLHILAQDTPGNLQFNSVKALSFDQVTSSGLDNGGTDYWFVLGQINVPEGKVWKITNTSLYMTYRDVLEPIDGSSLNSRGNLYAILRIGSQVVKDVGYLRTHVEYNSPVWLPTGSHEVKIDTYNYLANRGFYVSLNALEFNIIP